uniref:RNA 3'-terminal phosphate cyclase n=1 Tax=Strigamia maritima TaxID=126957 RepID=T1IN18_STRMM
MSYFRILCCKKILKMCAAIAPIEIDGALLEGGGQILRMSIAFCALLEKPIRIYNIRGGRSKPGLGPQHLTGLRLVRDLSKGKLYGDEIGSTEITFYPGKLTQGSHTADTHTAGSVGLLLQVALPCMIYANGPARVILKGGTNADMAPQFDYTTSVFQPIAEKFGCKFDARIMKRGYYPKGGGEVHVMTVPIDHLKAADLLEFGEISKITGRSFVAGVLPIKMAHQMSTIATSVIQKTYQRIPIDISVVKETEQTSVGNGSGIILVAETSTGCKIGGSGLGKKGISAERVGELAAEELIDNLKNKSCVDTYLQDQLIILMALAKGTSRIKTGPITLHTQTAIHVAKLLTNVDFEIKELEDKSVVIQCEGIGLKGNFDPKRCECSIPRHPPY